MECGQHIIAGHDVWGCGPLHPSVPRDPSHRKHRRVFPLCLSRASCGKHPKNIVLVMVSVPIIMYASKYIELLYQDRCILYNEVGHSIPLI